MAFRINNAHKVPDIQPQIIPKNSEKTKIYTQEDIDLIDEKYKEKELKFKKLIEPENHVLNQYKKNLVKEPVFEKETIIYDKNTGKWKVVKEPTKET